MLPILFGIAIGLGILATVTGVVTVFYVALVICAFATGWTYSLIA